MTRPLIVQACGTLILAAVLSGGCSNAATPEQIRADETLAKAKTHLGQGNNAEGRASLHEALALDRSLGRTARIGEEARLLGDLAAGGADYDSALSWYGLARESYRSLADRQSVRSLTIDMALSHQKMGEDRVAFALLNDALRLARVFKEDDGVRDIEWAMLPLCRLLEQYEEGTKIVAELESHFVETHETQQQARVNYEWGLLLSASRNNEQAIQKYLKAYAFADQSQDTVLAVNALIRLALSYDETGQTREAFAGYADGLKRAERSKAARNLRVELLTRVANAYLRAGQLSDAARFYRAAYAVANSIQNKVAVGTLLIQLGHCGLEGARDAAMKNYLSALELFKAIGYSPGIAYASLSLSQAHERAGEFTDALRECKTAIEQIEQSYAPAPEDFYADCEASWTGAVRSAAYNDLIGLLLHLGRNDEAFWYLERKNTRSLSEVFNTLDVQTAEPAVNQALLDLAHARAIHIGAERQLANLLATGFQRRDDISSAQRILESSARGIAEQAEGVARLKPSFAQIVRGGGEGMSEVQRSLPSGSTLVEYAATSRALYAFVMTKSTATVAVAPVDRATLVSETAELGVVMQQRVNLSDSAKAEAVLKEARIDELLSSLYNSVVRPIATIASSSAKLLVVLPDELSGLPVHALRPMLPKNSPYVAEKVFVSYLPSAGSLSFAGGETTTVKDVVAMGFPGLTGWDVEYELRDIRAFFKDAQLFFNQSATLPMLLKAKGDIIHLAVDIHYEPTRPGTAYMIFSDGAAIPGPHFHLLGDLFQVPRFPSMVISNLADDHRVIHPIEPWIFLANGTNALIMNSIVPLRQSKKLFGEYLYTSLLSGTGTQFAFRKAQLEMLKKQDEVPVYVWAPYFIWGK